MRWIKLKKLFYKGIGILGYGFLLSCSQTLPQYQTELPESPDTQDRFLQESQIQRPYKEASQPKGGLLLNQESPDPNAEEEYKKIQENFLQAIDMKNLSIVNINRETTYQEAQEILTPARHEGNLSYYKEGINILWTTEQELPSGIKQTPKILFITRFYRGPLNLGGAITKYMGDSFANQFDLQAHNIAEDKKAIAFINSLYKEWVDEKESHCFENKKCTIKITEENLILFNMYERKLFFGNDERRNLLSIHMLPEPHLKDDICFAQAFDLLNHRFICSGNEKSPDQFISIGENYEDIKYKTVGYGEEEKPAVPRNIPISYNRDKIKQRTINTIIRWANSNIEEKPDSLPKDSLLYSVRLLPFTERLFLMDHSLIQVRLKSDDLFIINKVPLPENWSPDLSLEQSLLKMDIKDETRDDIFYLSHKLSDKLAQKMENNHELQLNFIQALLDFFVQEKIKKDPEINIYQYHDFLNEDMYASLLLFPSQGPPQLLNLFLNRPYITPEVAVFSNPNDEFHQDDNIDSNPTNTYSNLDTYLAKNITKNTVDFKPEPKQNLNNRSFSGFQLGGKIYLKNKNIGTGTAIASFDSEGTQFVGTVLYSDHYESKVAYPNRAHVNYQTGESIAIISSYIIPEIKLHIQSTQTQIGSDQFEEYEIIEIERFGDAQALNLCGIEDFNIESRLNQKEFANRIIEQISQLTKDHQQANCPYVLSRDHQSYIFPNSQTAIKFGKEDKNTLLSIRIYKNPSYNPEDSQRWNSD